MGILILEVVGLNTDGSFCLIYTAPKVSEKFKLEIISNDPLCFHYFVEDMFCLFI